MGFEAQFAFARLALSRVSGELIAVFQLKSQRRRFTTRIIDAAYDKMREAILERRTPNILALHDDVARWTVQNLILVPSFAFSLSCLEKRKALRSSAERAGWVGCNILLVNIPYEARIPVVMDGQPANPASVRQQYDRLRPLEKLKAEARGWTLDVLNVVRRLDKPEFSLGEVYGFAPEQARLHLQNRNIEPKIANNYNACAIWGLWNFWAGGDIGFRDSRLENRELGTANQNLEFTNRRDVPAKRLRCRKNETPDGG